jgi:predicted acyl esterase
VETLFDGGLSRENDIRDLVARVDRIDVPVYFATSYFDRVVPASITTSMYSQLRARGDDVRLIVSNDAHGDIGSNFAVLTDLFTWLERQLEGDPAPLRDAPVASAQEWDANAFRLEHDWPVPATTATWELAGGELANVPVVSTAPWIPVLGAAVGTPQTVGLLPGDSLRFESEPATDLTELTGDLVVRLSLSTPDGGQYGQVTIALDEVTPDGTATQFARVRRGFSDLSSEPSERVLPLGTTSWRVEPGNRLRITITTTDVFEAAPALSNRGLGIGPGAVLLPVVDPNRVPPPGEPPSGSSFTADPVSTLCTALGVDC